MVIIMALEQMNEGSRRAIEEMRRAGKDPSELDPGEALYMAGPLITRGILVKELTKHGVMTKEADAQMGIDRLAELVEKAERQG